MGKPFKVETTPPRDSTGRFAQQQMVAPSPPQIVDTARRTGRSVDVVVADERVPDHPVETTTKQAGGGYQEQNPWPAAPPPHKPMRVG